VQIVYLYFPAAANIVLSDYKSHHIHYIFTSATSLGGGAGGVAPLNFKNSEFLVFLHTKFVFFHILPPPSPLEVGQIFAPMKQLK